MSILHQILVPFVALVTLLSGTPYTRMTAKVQSSVVYIMSWHDIDVFMEQGYNVCSGVVVAPNRVLTANHCVGLVMLVDRVQVTAVIRIDEKSDLALLAVMTGKPALHFSLRETLRFDKLFAFGYARDHFLILPVEVMLIDISPFESWTPGIIVHPGYIEGMSGGPVVNIAGEMVGIIQASNGITGYGVSTQTINAFLLGVK